MSIIIGCKKLCAYVEDVSPLQTMAMRLLDRERALLDRFVSLLENTEMIPGTALSLYAEVVSKHMELLAFRQVSLVPNRNKVD